MCYEGAILIYVYPSSSARDFLEMQILTSYPKPSELDALLVETSILFL